jgi:hypothetical protein
LTKEQLQAENAALRDEIGALYDLFAAAGEASAAGANSAFIVGYIGGIDEFERGNIPLLRKHADAIRRSGQKLAAVAS